jgi:signal transduction histidine kinase/CheY-like chemotaxis protein
MTFVAIALFCGLIVAVVTRIEDALRFAREETLRRQHAERVAFEARQLELVGRLAAGIAHDFNNNLTSIMGCAELLQLEHGASSELTDNILRSSQRLAELTRQLLAYSRKGRMVRAPVDLHALVNDVVSLLRRSTDPNVRVVTDLEASHRVVAADAALLQSAFLNLLVNARDAMPAGGTITVATSTVELPAAAGDGDGGPTGRCVVLDVRDTGEGIAPEVLPQIFDPFFTTKPLGRGTGLGLAAVAGTIKAHGGRIDVESVVATGTSFRVTLPVQGEPEPSPAGEGGGEIVRGEGHVLLIDDDTLVSRTAVATLQSFGYRVTHASDGATAVDLVRGAPRGFDVVLLDLRMPGMTGEATFAALKDAAPHLKILIWSGYGAEQDVSSMLHRGAAGFVQKPYGAASLSRTLANVLRKPGGDAG